MKRISVSTQGTTNYRGSLIRYEPELGFYLVINGVRCYPVKDLSAAHLLARALEMLSDPDLQEYRELLSEAAVILEGIERKASSSLN